MPGEDITQTVELEERPTKRTRIDKVQNPDENIDILPPSRRLLNLDKRVGDLPFVTEPDVGISEYISEVTPPISGIIKQRWGVRFTPFMSPIIIGRPRFTDFLVYEIDQEGRTVHIQSLDRPVSGAEPEIARLTGDSRQAPSLEWSDEVEALLSPILSTHCLKELRDLVSEGPFSTTLSTSDLAVEGTSTQDHKFPQKKQSVSKQKKLPKNKREIVTEVGKFVTFLAIAQKTLGHAI